MKECYQSPEREISIQSLLWKILHSWRGIIISAIVFAVLLSGLRYVKDVKSLNSANQTTSISTDEIEKQLTDDEKTAVEDAEAVKQQLEDKEEYKENSVLMNLNAYKKNVVTLQYYVNTNYVMNMTKDTPKDYTMDAVSVYVSYVGNRGIIEAMGTSDNSYVSELLSASKLSDSSDGNFVVYVVGKDADSAEELADKVDAAIKAYKSTVGEKIGSHELTLVERHSSVVADSDLEDQQTTLNSSISDLKTKLDTLEASLSANQLLVLNKDSQETKQADNTPTVSSATLSKKYIVLGAVMGIFLSCGWIALCYILSRCIRSSQELQDTYNLRIFGNVKNSNLKKKRFLAIVDCWIDRLQHKEIWTEEEQKELILTNIVVTCKKENITEVFVTTSLHLEEQDKKLVTKLLEGLKAAGIQIVFGENIMRNAKSLEQMSETGTVILVEKEAYSEYALLERELNLCTEQKANVLGVVVIE